MVALFATAVLGAPAASGKAKVIKTLGPADGTKDGPSVIAINRKTNTVYAADVGGGDGPAPPPDMVSVIDGKTDRIVANITVDDHPFGLAVDEKRNLVYVATVGGKLPTSFSPLSGGGGTIMVLDGKTNTVRKAKSSTFPLRRARRCRTPLRRNVPSRRSPRRRTPLTRRRTDFRLISPSIPRRDTSGSPTPVRCPCRIGEVCCSVPGRLSVYDPKTKRWLKGGADGIPAGITPIHPDIDPKLNRVYVTSLRLRPRHRGELAHAQDGETDTGDAGILRRVHRPRRHRLLHRTRRPPGRARGPSR